MPDAATTRQKQFLRRLGCKDPSKLSKQQASQLIEKLLAEEKASGKTFPCPYCKAKFGPRPRREKKCPSCGKTIVHLTGKFYTQEAADELYQKEWLKECQQDVRDEVKEEWREERKFRKEFGEPMVVGYKITAGPACSHAKHLEGLLILLEDANDTPDMLPPFEECRHDTCECEYRPISANETPRRVKVAEWADKSQQAKLTTRKTSPVSITRKNSGCASILLLAGLFVAAIAKLL